MLTPTGLTQHEILTIARKFTTSGITAKNLESVKAVVQEALRKKVNSKIKNHKLILFIRNSTISAAWNKNLATKIILELANFLNRVSEQLLEHSDFHYSPNKLRYVLGGAITHSPSRGRLPRIRSGRVAAQRSSHPSKNPFSDPTGIIKEWKWNNRLQQIRFIGKLSIESCTRCNCWRSRTTNVTA